MISSSGLYGAERVVLELAKGLRRKGGRPAIGILVNDPMKSRDMVSESECCDIETRVFHCHARFSHKIKKDLSDWICKEEFELVHSHGYKSNFYALWATKRRLPLVATNHNWLKHHWRLVAYSLLDKFLIRFFDRIIAVSDLIRDEMVSAGIPLNKIVIIDNGVDVEKITSKVYPSSMGGIYNEGETTKVVGSIGSLKEEKGFRFLLEAASQVDLGARNVKFLIIGEGPLRGELECLVKSHGAEGKIIFTGYRSDVYKILGTFDLFVLPSVKEGLPMVLLEAMAAGIPVIATRVGAVPKVISDGVNGLLVTPGDIDELRKAIERVLGDPSLAEALGTRGQSTVREKYSSESMFSKYYEIYSDVLRERK